MKKPSRPTPQSALREVATGGAQIGINSAIVAPVLAALKDLGFQTAATSGPEDGTVPSANANDLFDRSAAKLGDPAIGLSVASRCPVGALGPIDYALVSSASVREGLTRVAEYYNVVTDRIRLRLVEGPSAALVFERRAGLEISRHWLEFSMGMFASRLQDSVGPGFRFEEITFVHDAPSSTAAHEAFFAAPVRFDAQQDALRFASSWLDTPLRTAVASLARLLEAKLRELQSQRVTEDDLMVRFRAALESALDERDVALTVLARKLGTTPRTLQRELQRRGLSHREVIDDARRTRALELLDHGGYGLTEISTMLGFSDPSAFFRAFRRWTGTSPSAARAGLANER